MSVKTKAGGFLALAVVAAAGFYYLNPGTEGREGDHTVMTLMVTFKPDLIVDPVQIAVKFNGTKAFTKPAYESPWEHVIHVSPGTLVSLVTAHKEDLDLKCQITSKGVTYGPHRTRQSFLLRSCVVMATA